MFSHIMVGSNDIEASKVFYDAVLGTLGCKPGILSINPTGQARYLYIHENNMFIITEPINDEPASGGNGTTIGFSVPDTETGDAWHQAGIENGGETCEDPPGIRDVKKYVGYDMYLAYLRDPSGNKLCALKRMS